MEIIDKEEWRLYLLHNMSYYGRNILNFAQIWANKMEEQIYITGQLNLYIIKESFHYTFTMKGATSNQTKIALQVLYRVWKYGPQMMELLNEISPNNDFDPHDSWSGGNVDTSDKVRKYSDRTTGNNLHN
jgi:hypothetical protein